MRSMWPIRCGAWCGCASDGMLIQPAGKPIIFACNCNKLPARNQQDSTPLPIICENFHMSESCEKLTVYKLWTHCSVVFWPVNGRVFTFQYSFCRFCEYFAPAGRKSGTEKNKLGLFHRQFHMKPAGADGKRHPAVALVIHIGREGNGIIERQSLGLPAV